MSEMVERVAKAIADAAGSDFDRLPATHGPGHGLRNMYLRMARAAIEAMKGPTEEMCVAGSQPEDLGDIAGRYDAMISAALTD
jgi:hypothetical protein